MAVRIAGRVPPIRYASAITWGRVVRVPSNQRGDRLSLALLSLVTCVATIALPAPAAFAQSSSDEEARGLHAAGAAAFNAGRYEDALQYFQRAYDLSHRAALLYNVGQAADRARHDEVALDAFERYLDGVAEIENRAEIEGRVRVLRAAILERRSELLAADVERQRALEAARAAALRDAERAAAVVASPEVVTPTPATTSTPGVGPDPGAVVLVTAGGVVVVAGAIMVALGAPDIDGPRDGEIYANAVARQEGATTLVGVGGAALGLGVVGAVVGVVLLANAPTPAAGSLTLRPDGFAVAF
jgi:tetratricopeptide (TPR) repeat protein